MLGVLLRLGSLVSGEEGRAGAGANRAVARVVAGVGAKGSLAGGQKRRRPPRGIPGGLQKRRGDV